MLADVTIDGRTESQFRLAIEAMLREGGADEAARILKTELSRLSGGNNPLPGSFGQISASDLEVTGWDRLIERIGELDGPGDPITAVGVDICGMQAGLSNTPQLAFETTYYTDQAWGFSHADREGICTGYQGTTNAWQGAFEDIDDTLRVVGLDDLNAVIAALEHHCHSGHATPEEQQAFVVGACFLAVLVHQAVRDKAVAEGLPRPMAVLVGSNEAYPWFEAPALTARDGRAAPARHATTDFTPPPPIAFGRETRAEKRPLDLGAASPEMPKPLFDTGRAPLMASPPFAPPPAFDPASLAGTPLNAGQPFSQPPAFTEYSDSDEDEDEHAAPATVAPLFPTTFHDGPYADTENASDWETPDVAQDFVSSDQDFSTHGADEDEPVDDDVSEQDYAALGNINYSAQPAAAAPAADSVEPEEALHLPPPGIHVTGTQLRRRLVDRDTIEIEEERRPGLLERLFRRK